MNRYRSIVHTVVSLALFGIVTGAVAGVAARAFTGGMFALSAMLGVAPEFGSPQAQSPVILLFAVLLGAGLLVGALRLGSSRSAAPGPADAIEATHRLHGHIPTLAGLRDALASFVALGSGASAGQYGPLVHFGATLGALLARTRWLDKSMGRIGIGCGVAAAIAAAFSAPIAGVVFAHEVLLRHYSLRAFAPITIAAVTGHLFGTSLFDGETLAVLRAIDALPPTSYPALSLLGILSALLAKVFMHSVEFVTLTAERSPLPPWLHPVCGALGLGCLALLAPDVLGTGLWSIRESLLGHLGTGDTALLLGLKLLATAMCLGFGFAGGILGPSLLLGTLFGALFATALGLIVPGLAPPQVFAVGAMAAVTSAVIGAPLATILIIFELTHNYELTIAVMITVVLSNLVSYRLYGRSYFDGQLRARGIDFSFGHDRVRLQFAPIAPYISHAVPTVDIGAQVADARALLREARVGEAHLIDGDGRYRGLVRLGELPREEESTDGRSPIDDYATPGLTLDDTTSVWDAMQLMENYPGESVPVVSADGSYRGTLYEASIIRAYLDTLEALRREEHAVG